jgi:hypothetical protein
MVSSTVCRSSVESVTPTGPSAVSEGTPPSSVRRPWRSAISSWSDGLIPSKASDPASASCGWRGRSGSHGWRPPPPAPQPATFTPQQGIQGLTAPPSNEKIVSQRGTEPRATSSRNARATSSESAPDAAQHFRSQEQDMFRQTGQRFYWRPGTMMPQRSPAMSTVGSRVR